MLVFRLTDGMCTPWWNLAVISYTPWRLYQIERGRSWPKIDNLSRSLTARMKKAKVVVVHAKPAVGSHFVSPFRDFARGSHRHSRARSRKPWGRPTELQHRTSYSRTATMSERENNIYKAKLAEQAERYDGKCEKHNFLPGKTTFALANLAALQSAA